MGVHHAPRPSKVTADIMDVKEAQVAVIQRDGLRLGTAADAGRACVTPQRAGGVLAETYQFYVRTQGAPGPYQVRDPITRAPVPARDAEGRQLYDLDAVEKWNKSRPGQGARTGRPMKWTQMREELLTATRDGLLRGGEAGRPFHTTKDDLTPRELQRLRELMDAKLIALPRGAGGGRYRLTAAGERWLAEHARDRVACKTG